MSRTSVFRPEMLDLEQNGITRLAFPRMDDPKVIALWFGEGDASTPAFIRDAAIAALNAGETFYTHTRGRPELRSAIQAYLERLYGVAIAEDRITVPGASMSAITIAAQTALTTGDHALIIGPAWPNIGLTYRMTGAEVTEVSQTLGERGWQLDMDRVRDALQPNTRSIFVNSPAPRPNTPICPELTNSILRAVRFDVVRSLARYIDQPLLLAGSSASEIRP